MSRRGAVLENYKAPPALEFGTEAAQINAQMNQHEASLRQKNEQEKAKAQQQREKDLGDLEVEPGNSGTIYDPTGLKATQDLNTKMMAYAKANPDKPISEIKMMFAPEANKIALMYEKAKTIRLGTEAAIPELNRLGGYNSAGVIDKSIRMALIDPKTGEIRDDIATVDEKAPWWSEAIKAYPMETTTNEGLYKYVDKSPSKPNKVTAKIYNKTGGFNKENLVITAPSFMQLQKNEKGFNVKGADGTYLLEPKFEMVDGEKILAKDVYNDVIKNQPSVDARIKGEAISFIKKYNEENNIDKPIDDIYVEKVARGLLYNDLKTIWGHRGVQQAEESKPTQIKNITNVNTGGKDNSGIIRNVYKEIDDRYERFKDKFGTDYKIPVNELSATAQGVVIKYANEFTHGDLTQGDIYIQKDTEGRYNIVSTETGKAIAPIDFTDVNIKVQPNTKAKVEVVKEGNKKGSSKKSVSMGTLKSLVGTKDYKGYSLQEIVDYYKSNGYEVK